MYNQNFKNQAVKEVKNGSTIFSTAKKFDVATSTLTNWVSDYDKKMSVGIIRDEIRDEKIETPLAIKPTGIRLKSIKVIISGAVVTLGRNDVLKLLSLFDEFEKE
tara:strand:+ start:180 stop:494 length:315 start_codon:yes stop_codon:yes gene_type:complete